MLIDRMTEWLKLIKDWRFLRAGMLWVRDPDSAQCLRAMTEYAATRLCETEQGTMKMALMLLQCAEGGFKPAYVIREN